MRLSQYEGRLRRGQANFYCSRACAATARADAMRLPPDQRKARPGDRPPLPNRWCIVCSSEFAPVRIDQVYDGKDCWQKLVDWEKTTLRLHAEALVRQDYVCFWCQTSLEALLASGKGRLGAVVLEPRKTTSGVVAACTACRKTYYQGYASTHP